MEQKYKPRNNTDRRQIRHLRFHDAELKRILHKAHADQGFDSVGFPSELHLAEGYLLYCAGVQPASITELVTN